MTPARPGPHAPMRQATPSSILADGIPNPRLDSAYTRGYSAYTCRHTVRRREHGGVVTSPVGSPGGDHERRVGPRRGDGRRGLEGVVGRPAGGAEHGPDDDQPARREGLA